MDKINCLIIEDQIPAQETLKKYIQQVPYLSLMNTYISPLQALQDLDSGAVDLLFLDIHLPKLSGIELLKSIQHPPPTVLTTAFSEYAVEGFDLDVVDYLLKPFSFERFLKAISKIPKTKADSVSIVQQDYLFVRNKSQLKKIAISTIEYVEAKGDFTLICTKDTREIANISLTDMLEALGSPFVRCHRSYIVNLTCIEKIIGNFTVVSGKQIPIGRKYKGDLMKRIRLI